MAITITPAETVAAARVGGTPEELAEITRVLGIATAHIARYLGDSYDDADAVTLNGAAVQLARYLYDQPTVSGGVSFANAMRFSGASNLLFGFRIHRAGLVGGDAVAIAQEAIGSVGNPVVGVDVVAGELLITFADGVEETHTLPTGGGVDQTARDAATGAGTAAATAQTGVDANTAAQTAHDANPNAHHIPTTPGGDAVSESARLPIGNVALRLGWAQSQTPTEAIFTRANDHPIDGAAVGTVAGTPVPVFPPALNTDPTLYLFIWIATAQANIADTRLSGGGGTLVGSVSNGAAYTVEGVAGTLYVSNQRLSASLSAYQISAIVGGDLIASQPWVTEQIAAASGAPTYTSIVGGTSLDAGLARYTLSDANANALADAIVNATYPRLLVTITDFGRHYNVWEIVLGWRAYAYGPNHEFYSSYVDNGDGSVHGMNLAIDRDSSTAQAVGSLSALGTGATFNSGSILTIYGVTVQTW